MQKVVWPFRFLLFLVTAILVLTVERFVLPLPRVPLSWEYWLVLFLLVLQLHMWVNDFLGYRKIGDARPYQVKYDDNADRSMPVVLRLMVVYPVFIFGLGYGVWYLRNYLPSIFHAPA